MDDANYSVAKVNETNVNPVMGSTGIHDDYEVITDNDGDIQDRKNPQYIPKLGLFYEHDDRLETSSADVDDKHKIVSEVVNISQVQSVRTPLKTAGSEVKKISRSDAVGRWGHDRYLELDQAPKSTHELINTYGYDIRSEENAPRSRRRRRYGRGPTKYARNWQDEQAYQAHDRISDRDKKQQNSRPYKSKKFSDQFTENMKKVQESPETEAIEKIVEKSQELVSVVTEDTRNENSVKPENGDSDIEISENVEKESMPPPKRYLTQRCGGNLNEVNSNSSSSIHEMINGVNNIILTAPAPAPSFMPSFLPTALSPPNIYTNTAAPPNTAVDANCQMMTNCYPHSMYAPSAAPSLTAPDNFSMPPLGLASPFPAPPIIVAADHQDIMMAAHHLPVDAQGTIVPPPGFAEVRGGVTYFNHASVSPASLSGVTNKRPTAAIPIVDPTKIGSICEDAADFKSGGGSGDALLLPDSSLSLNSDIDLEACNKNIPSVT